MEKKSEIMGIQKAPQNAPRKKEIKKDRPRVDVGLTLEQRLVDLGEPAIGLDHITEFTNPRIMDIKMGQITFSKAEVGF